jgi:hypothetical protein
LKHYLVLLGFSATLSCNIGPTKALPSKQYSKSLVSLADSFNVAKESFDFRFPWRVHKLREKFYFIQLDLHGNLRFQNFIDSSRSFKLNIQNYIKTSSPIIECFIQDSLIGFLNREAKKIYRLSVTQENTIASVDSFPFSFEKDTSYYFVSPNYDQPFFFHENKLLIPYGIRNRRKKFVDHYRYWVWDMVGHKSSQIFKTPDEIKNETRFSKNSYLLKFKESLFCFFESIDLVYSCNNKNDQNFQNIEFNPFSNFAEFESDRGRDLGYIRIYEETNEANLNYLATEKYIVLIKRMKRKSIYDKISYEYLILDPNNHFKIKYYNVFQQNIHPRLAFSWKNGFAVVDASLTKFYYYEIP